jgi:hypothetical protein
MFIEDEQFCYSRFSVLNTYLGESGNLSEDVTLEDLTFKIVAYNTVTNVWFDLRSLSIDLSDQIASGNIQDINLDSTRGYVLTDTDIFNSLKLTTDTNILGRQYYDLEIGYKIPWQDWLALPYADTIFLDRTKSQNGLNQNASNYSGVNDYVIKILIEANVETTGITTNYVQPSGDFEAYNYNTDDQAPDAYSCVINTFKKDGTPILNNVIQDEFTEVRAVVTPLVPPVFSQDVDMTEVSSVWTRIAHGEIWIPTVPPTFEREPNWFDGQADDNDNFGSSSGTAKKGDIGLYTSTTNPNQILANENNDAYYGCISIDEYSFYSINGKMFSDSIDNDTIGFVIAFDVDENGVETTLSLLATTGGAYLGLNPLFDVNNPTSGLINSFQTIGSPTPTANYALVYNYGKRDCTILDSEFTGSPVDLGWNSALVGDLDFTVNRTANDIEVMIDWTIDSVNYLKTFNYNILSNPLTEKFNGLKSLGFAFFSQDQGGFKDVVLSFPNSDYYGVLRMETKNSPSDFAISELNTEIVNTDSSLLKQITGDENKATLSFDGTDFIIQGLVNTDNITQGEEYKFSALLRRKDLTL